MSFSKPFGKAFLGMIAIAAISGSDHWSSVAAVTAASQQADDLKAPYHRPAQIPFPATNPYTPEKAALGKALYFDPRLSGNQNMSCGTCHNPSFGWEAPDKTAVGAQNTHLGRKGPTILNTAWNGPFFWDGRAATAEDQAKGPIQASGEMNLQLDALAGRLAAIPDYKIWFAKAFPGEPISGDTVAKAIATYERTVVASYAPFDRWVEGDETAISESAKRGFVAFTGKAGCSNCHTGWNFTDNKFHDIGTTQSDIGRGKLEPNNISAQFAFKTPTLRDTAQRAPYMHDGEVPTLEDVIYHYIGGGIDRPSRSKSLPKIDLSPDDVTDLVAFMKTLTGERQVVALPILPN